MFQTAPVAEYAENADMVPPNKESFQTIGGAVAPAAISTINRPRQQTNQHQLFHQQTLQQQQSLQQARHPAPTDGFLAAAKIAPKIHPVQLPSVSVRLQTEKWHFLTSNLSLNED